MPVNRRGFLRSALAGSVAAAAGWPAWAAPGKLYYGYPPGGATWKAGSLVMKEMHGRYQPDLGLEMVHVPGDSGLPALQAAAKGPADGGTVLYCATTTMTLLPQLRSVRGVNVETDFTPVVPLVEVAVALTVGPLVPDDVRTMADYLRWARDNPYHHGYGVPALGGGAHFAGMSVARTADLPLRSLLYRGMEAVGRDLAEGGLAAGFTIVGGTSAKPGDKLRPLALTGPKRWPARPDLPTLKELGLSEVSVNEGVGLHVPSATPPAKVQELADAAHAGLRSADLAALLAGNLVRPVFTSPQAFAADMADERAQWQAAVKRERFTLQG